MRRTQGFTLIELMVTIAVLAILLTIAVPSFTNLIRDSQARAQINEYRSMFNYARTEAVNRGQDVVINRLGDNRWAIATGSVSSCEASGVLRCFRAPRPDMSLQVPSFPSGGLTFTPQGQITGAALDATPATLVLTSSYDCKYNRVFTVTGIGRVRITQGACS